MYIGVDRKDQVVTVTLNRPDRKNAVIPEMWDELLEVVDSIAHGGDDRAVVVTGAGGSFSSGHDLAGAGKDRRHPILQMRRVGEVCAALHRLPQPTIAKVVGIAAGAGMNLALACDLIVASDDARFAEIFSRRGLSIDCGGSWLLPRLVGLQRAKELVFFADTISAGDALDIGLVNRVVPKEEIDAFVDGWARRLAAGPPIALGLSKRLLNNAATLTLDQALEDEAIAQAVNYVSKDTAEAVSAFLEKRDPVFRGR